MIEVKNHHILSIRTKIIHMGGHCHKSCLLVVLSGLKIHLNLVKIL